jgi:3-amino-4-hydroxybenzoic acid synthase
MTLCWVDIREAGPAKRAIVEEAIHQRVDGIVSSNADDLDGLPPTVNKILLADAVPDVSDPFDVVVLSNGGALTDGTGCELGRFIEVIDAESLDKAAMSAQGSHWSVLKFRDPTKIPLEIVLAAAANSEGRTITLAETVEEARIVAGVLEHGPDGVMMPARAVGEVTALKQACSSRHGWIELVELEVVASAHVGMGERACVDTCSMLAKDEGILVGSHSKGMILCVSETHPLPYMPTRPFRVNAGAVHSYTLGAGGRTTYLSELHSGAEVMVVSAGGDTRMVPLGRVKIETRPLISIDAVSAGGVTVNLILQDDWHVRVLGPGASVLNCTELVPGSKVLGHLPTDDRHVGYPIDEYCVEK